MSGYVRSLFRIARNVRLFIVAFILFGYPVDVQRMIQRAEIVQLTGRTDDVMDARITELDHLAGLRIDQMVMLPAVERFFILGNVPAELMLDHQVAVQKKLYRIVEGGPADLVVLVLHRDIQRFYVEMSVGVVDLFQDGKTFRCLAMTFFLQILFEDLFYRLLCLGI